MTDAILGVALFKEQAPNSFGRFNRAFVSMFRIAGGETWIDGLPFLDDTGDIYWKSTLFVCTYLVLNVWVVLQVLCSPKILQFFLLLVISEELRDNREFLVISLRLEQIEQAGHGFFLLLYSPGYLFFPDILMHYLPRR